MKGTLLEGNIRRILLALALPLLIGNVLQQLYNAADSLIIRSFLGTDEFSAVGLAGTAMNLMIFIISGFCTGIAAIFAQLYGKGDREGFRRQFFTAAVLGAGVTLVLAGVFYALLRPLLLLINSPEELIPISSAYLRIIILGMLCTFLNNLLSCILRAIGDTRAATIFLFASVLANTLLDLLLVGPMNMGVSGAALATVLSQLISACLCFIYIQRRDHDLLFGRADARIERGRMKQTLVYGFSAAMHMSSLYIGKFFVQGAVNLLGTQGIAAYTAAMRIEGFANSFGTSHGEALTVFLSQNRGAGKMERVREGIKQSALLGTGMGLALSVLLYAFSGIGTRFFLGEGAGLAFEYGRAYLAQIAIFYLLCFSGNTFVGIFRGNGLIYIPMTATMLHISVRALLSHYWVRGGMNLRAIALATGVGWIIMTLYQFTMSYIMHKKGRL